MFGFGFAFAVCLALFALLGGANAEQRQFALTDKVAQGNFAYGEQPLAYSRESPKFYHLFAKRNFHRFAYKNDEPLLFGLFAKMIPSNQRDFAFA